MLISDYFFSEALVVSVLLITGSFIVKESSYFIVLMVSVVSILSAFKYSEALLFVVKQTERWDEDDHRVVDTYRLEAAPLEKGTGFDLKKEDPQHYKDEVGYHPGREWEDIPLPQLATAPQSISQQVIKMALQVHHTQVKFLHSLGIDACREYQQTNIDYILEAVQPGEVVCKVCGDKKSSTQALKGHIRSKHMDSTPYKCTTCQKYFGDNSTYKAHKKIHEQSSKVVCNTCQRVFPSQARLTQHAKTHDPSKRVFCKYCNKAFNAKKNLAPHEKTCSRQPGGKKAAVKDQVCPHCPKAFYHKKDLNYHLKTAHKSRAGQKL